MIKIWASIQYLLYLQGYTGQLPGNLTAFAVAS